MLFIAFNFRHWTLREREKLPIATRDFAILFRSEDEAKNWLNKKDSEDWIIIERNELIYISKQFKEIYNKK